MNNYLRKILLWFFGSVIVLFLLAVALAAIFEDSIGKKIVLELNNHITSKLSVGDVSLSLIRHFPRASATLENVKLLDTQGNILMQTKELAFTMSIWSAFSDNPDIHMVQIKNGVLNLVFDEKGNGNYDIFKKQKTTGPNNFKLKISKAVLDHLTISYKNANKQTDVSATIEEGELKGDFNAERYLLDLDTKWMVHYISHASHAYFKNKPLSIEGKFDINTQQQTYVVKECKTNIAENLFDIKGTVKNLKSGLDFDMYATGDNIRVENLLLLLDGISQKSMQDFKSKGIVKMDTRVNGVLNGQNNPSIVVSYNLTNGSLTSKRMAAPFENLSFKGQFNNGWARNMRTSVFTLNNCKGTFNGIPIGMELKVNNLEAPLIDFVMNGKLPLAKMYGLLGKDKVQGGSGYITINKLSIKGALADMKSKATVQRVVATGDIDFDNAVITANGEEVKVFSGKVLIRNNNISFDNIELNGFDTKMKLEGSVSNYLPFILNSDLESKLTFKSSITAPYLNVEKLLKAYSADRGITVTETKAGTVVTGTSQNIISRLEGRITINIDHVVAKKIDAREFAGVLIFEDGGMLVSGDIQAMDGDWNLEGKFTFNKGTNLVATLESNKINIKEFFRQANNFDQKTITDQHLSGRLNSRMLMNLHWNEQGDFDKDHMHVYAALSIDNGELNRFKLLENLSKFVKLEDLRHIRFVNLKNLLEIDNGKIYLPAMFLQSNAVNLTVSGEHSFNNNIDYNMKLNVGEIIMKKFNLFGKGNKEEHAKKDGFFNMYYRLTGTIDNFTQKKDRSAVLANFTKSEIRKQRIMNALLEEFGSLPGFDEPSEWVDESIKITKASYTPSSTAQTTTKASLTSEIKSSWSQAKQTLKNPAKAAPAKTTRKTFKDEEDEKEEFLEFK